MRNSFKNLFLVPLLLSLAACASFTRPQNLTNDGDTEATEETVKDDGLPSERIPGLKKGPKSQVIVAQAMPHTLPDPTYVALNQVHQSYAKKFDLDVNEVKASWSKNMGSLLPSSIKDGETFNHFLQFIRETGGDEFATPNDRAAISNNSAHDLLKASIVEAPNVNALKKLKEELIAQKEILARIKNRILSVASLYEVALRDSDMTQGVFKTKTENFGQAVADQINPAYPNASSEVGQTVQQIQKELRELLYSSTVVLDSSDQRFSFVTFSPYRLILANDNFVVENRLYGAFETADLAFQDKILKAEQDQNEREKKPEQPKPPENHQKIVDLAKAMHLTEAQLIYQLQNSIVFGAALKNRAGADQKLSAEEMNKAIQDGAFPPKIPNPDLISFLANHDGSLAGSLKACKVSDNKIFALHMVESVERLAILLRTLYDSTVIGEYNVQMLYDSWWLASEMKFGNDRFEPFTTGFNRGVFQNVHWEPEGKLRGNIRSMDDMWATGDIYNP